MAFCRMSPDSDVYAFPNCNGDYECCLCALPGGHCMTPDVTEFLAHLEQHRQAGHKVPAGVTEGVLDWERTHR